ncbi:MAG: helix-turn-helix domain-containing protein [Myxococcales bacterium]|nr:helix-turn-helix domain-containing protein [Myxococcales bacterium]MCB9718471.1 helix-turn-helix domain-containing protein [Myxococcales bacterium]
MLSAAEVKALRSRLHMSRAQFARLCGVDSRTVVRWETPDGPRPTGAAQAVMAAIQEKLDSDPGSVKRVVKFLAGAAAVGGLAYVMLKLLGTINGSSGEEE